MILMMGGLLGWLWIGKAFLGPLGLGGVTGRFGHELAAVDEGKCLAFLHSRAVETCSDRSNRGRQYQICTTPAAVTVFQNNK